MKRIASIAGAFALALLAAGAAFASDKVDINTADAAELDRVLLNVGPSKAAVIVEHRNTHGPFKSLEELALVKGIGLKTVERNRDRIEIGGVPVPSRPAGGPGGAGGKVPGSAKP